VQQPSASLIHSRSKWPRWVADLSRQGEDPSAERSKLQRLYITNVAELVVFHVQYWLQRCVTNPVPKQVFPGMYGLASGPGRAACRTSHRTLPRSGLAARCDDPTLSVQCQFHKHVCNTNLWWFQWLTWPPEREHTPSSYSDSPTAFGNRVALLRGGTNETQRQLRCPQSRKEAD